MKSERVIEHGLEPIAAETRMRDEAAHNRQLASDFDVVFMRHPRGPAVLAEIARILHFTVAAKTPEDMALQNAFKSILHRMGRWTDDDEGADEIIGRIIGR